LMAEQGVLDGAMRDPGASGSEVGVTFRNGWVRHLRVVLSSAGGAAIILALFELIQRQPGDSFQLLTVWGPWPVVGIIGLAILGKFLSRINDSIQTAFSAAVTSVQQGSEAHIKTANALTQLAEQGGRQAQEIQRLAIYAAQEMSRISERMDDQDQMLRSIDAQLKSAQAKGEAHG
jgi:hypothetical protein